MADDRVEWAVWVATPDTMAAFPRLLAVSVETRVGVHYDSRSPRWTRHPWWVFQYTLSGCGVFCDGRGRHRLTPGCGFLCCRQDPGVYYAYPNRAREPWRFLYVNFCGATAVAMAREIVDRWGAVHELPRQGGVIAALMDFHRYGSGFYRVTASEGAECVTSLLLALAGSHTERSSSGNRAGALVRAAQQEMERSVCQPVQVGTVAARLGVSREHLSRAFARETGTTPYRYMVERKVQAAMECLRGTDMRMEEIADMLGFSSAARFNAVFARVCGSPPARWRRNERQSHGAHTDR